MLLTQAQQSAFRATVAKHRNISTVVPQPTRLPARYRVTGYAAAAAVACHCRPSIMAAREVIPSDRFLPHILPELRFPESRRGPAGRLHKRATALIAEGTTVDSDTVRHTLIHGAQMAQFGFRVLILGYGEMGHAMHHLLHDRHDIRVWQRRPSPEFAAIDIERSASDSDFVIFCLPAQPLFELARRIAPKLSPKVLCITFAKGLDEECRTPAEALADGLEGGAYAVLYGPMISEEIRAGRPAFAQCGVLAPSAFERIRTLFRGTTLHLETAADITGLSWSAVLKNVYAMAFGMSDELGFGDNTRGFLSVVAVRELDSIVMQLGGQPATPYSLAGLGDLITTATSAGSHHHELGRLIARGVRDELKGEGIHTLSILRTANRFEFSAFPLFNLIDACVRDPDTTRARLTAFLERAGN